MPASEPSNTRNCNTGITTTSALVADVDHTTRLTNGVRYSRRRFLSASAPLPVWLIPSPRERDSHAGDSQGEGNMIHRGKREGVCHGGCGSSSQGLRGRANTRAGEAV